jgi:hypothetical protein
VAPIPAVRSTKCLSNSNDSPLQQELSNSKTKIHSGIGKKKEKEKNLRSNVDEVWAMLLVPG